MVSGGEQSAITPTAAAEPGVERGRASGVSRRRLAGESSDEEEGSQRFSDAEDRSSWHSHSRHGSALEDCTSASASVSCDAGAGGDTGERGRKSCVSECSLGDDVVVDLEAGLTEIARASPDKAERNCRICHLGLDSAAAESGAGIVLGCSCKDDLSRAHKQCAETWFKIRGNKICEICGSTACNVAGFCDAEFIEQWNESSNTASAQASATEPRRFWQGHRFLNFLLACMVFAFVISWLFHFNVPG